VVNMGDNAKIADVLHSCSEGGKDRRGWVSGPLIVDRL
jgi:hypothetical protein